MQNNDTIKSGDIYCGQERKTGKYFAYQIIDVKKEIMTYLLLDYFDEKFPEEKAVKEMKPFRRHRWFFKEGTTNYSHSERNKLPEGAAYAGHRTPLISGECKVYGCWPNGYDNVGEEEWAKIPTDARQKFKAALNDTAEIVVSGIECRRSFQYIDDKLLSAMDNYSELEKLPVAYSFSATKFYPSLIPFLETRWTATKLDWKNHGQNNLDLSRTHLREITLDGEGLKSVSLPESCRTISFSSTLSPELKVYSPDGGSNLTLKIELEADHVPDVGLPQLEILVLDRAVKLDLLPVTNLYPNLYYLRICGKPGYLSNISSLRNLKTLEVLSLEEIFGFTAEEFPTPGTCPLLNTLWMESIPEEAGKQIKKKYKGKITELDIRKLRKPEWLAENLDNPLRHWDGSEFVPPAKFKKAVVIYRNARRDALVAANQYLIDRDAALLQNRLEQTGKEFVIAFNKLDGKSGFIETEEREDLCAAFQVILDAVDSSVNFLGFTMNHDRIWEIMNEHRDW